jgi:hypothetical protein
LLPNITVLLQPYLFWFCMAQLEAKLTVGTGDEESETEYGKSVISLKKNYYEFLTNIVCFWGAILP